MAEMAGNLLPLLGLVLVGFATGIFYFQGLWWTLKGLPTKGGWTSRVLGSFVLRATVVVAVFYLLMANDWQRVLALTLGFLVARYMMVRRIKGLPPEEITEQAP